jgi:hypothetical protein
VAEARGQTRMAQMNQQEARNLEKILTAREEKLKKELTRWRQLRPDNTAPIIAAVRHRHELMRQSDPGDPGDPRTRPRRESRHLSPALPATRGECPAPPTARHRPR